MTITLTPELAQIVERLVANGGYSSPDDVLRKALQKLDQHLPPAAVSRSSKPCMLDILQELPPPHVFPAAADADDFLREERNSWDK